MEERIGKTKNELAEKLDLPRDIMMDFPKIIIIGDNEITIENHKGIVVFDEKQVKIKSKVGLVCINGMDFQIPFLGGSTITLKGKFKSIVYEKDE